jgi:hypothetical protein
MGCGSLHALLIEFEPVTWVQIPAGASHEKGVKGFVGTDERCIRTLLWQGFSDAKTHS